MLVTWYDGGNRHRKWAKGTESVAGSPQGVVLILNLSRTRVSSEHAEFADVVERSSV
ncbi:ornithine carbamoyltransferase [Mycolicibacterium smegmatis]|uniref:Ornithine carbamoyltransferase n=1 Tax=Mycolicibacterium smegmatis (strain ATCC 700084 / mc(2)155) TaxID=246196 RepID=A0R1H0_MYCS2|nr:ornithine carbamoyltransferase [Mycolicibacterium smegmatis MC2 155]AIU16427.1 ornithine carbamoyltransferase [Mycolicibacterium smegmatis]AIU09802.1 ornithine carbamoyltransferase [Mycolicibacterium smegmatis MC2 155]AIU23050.1 ornithine carbamoyltransferase [Mycolicibacterium smegmatis]TBH50760.1 ornithine carbamoyltransferase [Mycolicibacterium smegmatis MC2 155]